MMLRMLRLARGCAGGPAARSDRTALLQHVASSCRCILPAGACITSWKQASGDEVLYMRPDAVFDKSKPISGGIPHCFPQVGGGAAGAPRVPGAHVQWLAAAVVHRPALVTGLLAWRWCFSAFRHAPRSLAPRTRCSSTALRATWIGRLPPPLRTRSLMTATQRCGQAGGLVWHGGPAGLVRFTGLGAHRAHLPRSVQQASYASLMGLQLMSSPHRAGLPRRSRWF